MAELTADSADIQWTVHVANSKAHWYQWQMAMDIPEAAAIQVPLRNASMSPDARSTLVIDAGPRAIAGKNTAGPDYALGAFMGVDVYLGELRTNDRGWLMFLPGRGVSASPTGSPIFNEQDPNGFINADGWYDDICDGPVTADACESRGVRFSVESAWVISAPPNYAPGVLGVRTLYDVMVDIYVAAGWMSAPNAPSFRHDVYPILHRLTGLQWVNKGFATQFGPGGSHDFNNPDNIARLARNPKADGIDAYRELRQQVLLSFRPPQPADGNQWPWPWLYGDAMDVPAIASPRQNAVISQTQYNVLSVGQRQFLGRLGPPVCAARVDRRRRARGAAGDARSGCAGPLPRRCVSPRVRVDLADASSDPLLEAIPDPPSTTGCAVALLRQDAHAAGGHGARRTAVRTGAGRLDAMDGTALAGRYGLLPRRL